MARKPLMHRYIIFETLEVGPDWSVVAAREQAKRIKHI